MTGRPAEELLQLYQELTHPGGNYYTSTSIQPQRRGYADVRPASGGVGVGDSSTPVNVSTRNGHAAASLRGDGGANRSKHHATSANDDRKGDGKDIQLRAWRVTAEDGVGKINNKSSSGSRRYTTRSSHNHAVGQGSASVGLVNSRSGSTRLSARLAQALKQHRGDPDINNGNLDNPQPNDVGTSGIPDGDGVIHRHVELSLSSQPEASQRFACWLCETPCAGPGWLNAPTLYTCAGAADSHNAQPQVPVSLLTLCSRCSAACALPADVPHDVVLRRAGATRALAQRSELFVTSVREHKLLLEVLAVDAEDMAARDTVSLPNGLLPSALWEFPSEVQWDVLRQLIGALESALEVNARAPPGGDTDGLSCHERDLLAEELAWLQRQLPRIHHDTAMHERPLKLSNRISVTAQVGHRTRFDGMHTPSSSLNGISPCSLSHTDQQRGVRSEMAPQPAGMRVTSSATSTGSRTKPPPPQQLEEEQEKREAIPGGERRREALDQMMERALAARVQKGHLSPGLPADKGEALPENRGSDGAKDSWPAEPIISAVPSNAKDTDNILLRYFEGRLKDLPPFKLLPMEVMTSGGKDSNALQLLQGASTALQGPRDATRNTNSPNVMGVPTGMTLVAADAVDTATIDTASLLERLREEQRRRIEAEDALRESHQRIAALEKVTDHVSELAIHLNSAVARQLLAMQQLLRAATQSCVEITMQKSLLFSEEMTALMRQTQRHVYGVHALPPWSKAGGGPMAARAISHVPSVPLRAEEQASPAPSTARAPSYPFPTSLQLVPLKSSSCSAASPLQ